MAVTFALESNASPSPARIAMERIFPSRWDPPLLAPSLYYPPGLEIVQPVVKLQGLGKSPSETDSPEAR